MKAVGALASAGMALEDLLRTSESNGLEKTACHALSIMLELSAMATNENDAVVSEWARNMGRRGGKARLTKMTADERTRIAKLAAETRWRRKTEPDPTDPNGPNHDQRPIIRKIMLTSGRRPHSVGRRPHPGSLPLFPQAVAA